MSKDKPKPKKLKGGFTVNLYHDGVFVASPIRYLQGDVKQITDIDFEGMSFEDLTEIVRRLVLGLVKSLYYCKTGKKLGLGIKELKSDSDVDAFLKLRYDNGFMVDLYVDHFGYDVMDYLNFEDVQQEDSYSSTDEYSSDDGDEIDYVDFYKTGEEDVVIENLTIQDDFLNRLCSNTGLFRGSKPKLVSSLPNIPEEDPDASTIDPKFKIKRGVVYPVFNPNIPWNQMEPVLWMRYEDPKQLKLALTNYGVAHGYQLWYMKNEWKSLLVLCGRNVEEGRCVGKKGKKDWVLNKNRKKKADTNETSSKSKKVGSKGVKKKVTKNVNNVAVKKKVTFKGKEMNDSGVGSIQSPVLSPTRSPGKKRTRNKIKDDKKPYCPFRLYASWMSLENSFQIKSLIPDHKCSRNYNLGSLVNYRWIATQCAREIIRDHFIPLRTMKEDIRQKYMVDEYYLRLDKEALRETLEEQARADQEYLDRYRAEQIRKARMDWLHPSHWSPIDNPTQPTQQSVAQQVQENVELNPSVDHVDDATASSAKKNDKTPMTADMQVYEITPPPSKQQKDKAHPLPFRIHVKNRGRSERISNQKKLFKFDDKGTRSNPELAFDCSP